jgi:hypothetical protein
MAEIGICQCGFIFLTNTLFINNNNLSINTNYRTRKWYDYVVRLIIVTTLQHYISTDPDFHFTIWHKILQQLTTGVNMTLQLSLYPKDLKRSCENVPISELKSKHFKNDVQSVIAVGRNAANLLNVSVLIIFVREKDYQLIKE